MNRQYFNLWIIVTLLILVFISWKFYQQEQTKVEISQRILQKQLAEEEENKKLAESKYYQVDIVGYNKLYTSLEIRWLNWKADYKVIIWAKKDKDAIGDNFIKAISLDTDIKKTMYYSLSDVDGFEVLKLNIDIDSLTRSLWEKPWVYEYSFNGSKAVDKDTYKRIDTLGVSHNIPIILD